MDLFLNSLTIDEIDTFYKHRLVHGVCADPSMLGYGQKDFLDIVTEICAVVSDRKDHVFVPLPAFSHEELLEKGRVLGALGPQPCLGLPPTLEGLRASYLLHEEGYKTSIGPCFTANQALLAARAKATFVTIAVRAYEENIGHVSKLLREIRALFYTYTYPTKILATSLRSTEDVSKMALLGVDGVAIDPAFLAPLTHHPLSMHAHKTLLADWNSTGQTLLPHKD